MLTMVTVSVAVAAAPSVHSTAVAVAVASAAPEGSCSIQVPTGYWDVLRRTRSLPLVQHPIVFPF